MAIPAAIATACACAALAVPSPARAANDPTPASISPSPAPTRVALSYAVDARGAECPDEVSLRALVTAQLGYDPFEPLDAPTAPSAPARTRVSVRIASGPRGPGAHTPRAAAAPLEAALIWTDDRGRWRGERTIAPAAGTPESRDCAALIRGVAFTLAVQLQLREPPHATEADATRTQPGPLAPPPTAFVEVEPGPEPRDSGALPARWLLSVGPALALGLTPDASVQGRLTLTVLFGRLSFDLGVQAGLPSEKRVVDAAAFRALPWLIAAHACTGRTALSLCGVGKFGQLRVQGVGVDAPEADDGFLVQAGLAVVLRRELGPRMYVLALAEILGTLSRWSVLLNDAEVWSTSRVAGAAAVALGARFR